LGAAGALLVIALVYAGLMYRDMRSMGFFREPVFETERPSLPTLGHPAVLVFDKTNSFIHKDAIPAANALLQEMAGSSGWSVFTTSSGGVFNSEDLAHFDVMVWNNVTGDVLLPEQRAAMKHWLEAGGGFVGLHSAGDDSHEVWPWYQDTVIRAHFIGHPMDPQFQKAAVHIDRAHPPLIDGIPDPWVRTDEWYSFASSPRAPDVRVLATLDESSYSPGSNFRGNELAMGADHPVIWQHCVGRGRVFYSALGHTAESYAEPEYRELLRHAIAWAARQDPAGDSSSSAPLTCETP
jgi:hypothetical protein